jgi:hypothetical protein
MRSFIACPAISYLAQFVTPVENAYTRDEGELLGPDDLIGAGGLCGSAFHFSKARCYCSRVVRGFVVMFHVSKAQRSSCRHHTFTYSHPGT